MTSEPIKRASITKTKDDEYKAMVTKDDGTSETETFATFEEANTWMTKTEYDMTETPEKAASDMSVEEAEAINSNVHQGPIPAGATAASLSIDDEQ